jgi:hypothetical protein
MPYIVVGNAADPRSARLSEELQRNFCNQAFSIRLASATWNQKLSTACCPPFLKKTGSQQNLCQYLQATSQPSWGRYVRVLAPYGFHTDSSVVALYGHFYTLGRFFEDLWRSRLTPERHCVAAMEGLLGAGFSRF